jgi:hypothetical protein
MLDSECDLESDWANGINKQFANGLVDPSARNVLTWRLGMLDTFTLAHVVREQPPATAVIANRHAFSTTTAEDEPLE